MLITGFAIERLDTSAAFAAIAAIFLLVALFIARHPVLRDFAPPNTAAPDDDGHQLVLPLPRRQ